MDGFVRMLHAGGYSALTPDSRGHGWTDGSLVTYGVKETRDVSRWLDWLQAHFCGAELYGLGESLGGSVLLQSLANETRFRAVVAECSFSTFPDIARDRLDQMLPIPSWTANIVTAPVVYGGLLYAFARYGIDLRHTSAVEGVHNTQTPVLLIHGLADSKTPIAHSRAIAASNPAIQLWEVPGAEHVGAYATVPQEFERRVVGWFQSHP
jgi:predicted alpha/beta-fold hydrolase